MSKEVIKLIVRIIVAGAVIVIIATAAQLIDRENVLDRIIQWPDLEVQTLEGKEITTVQLLSGNPILLNYFNTECIYCQSEVEDIAHHKKLQEAVILVFISDENPSIIKQFRQKYGLDENPKFQFLVDSGRQMKDYYRIRSVPATYLYDADGKLIEFYRGEIKAETLYSHVAQLDD